MLFFDWNPTIKKEKSDIDSSLPYIRSFQEDTSFKLCSKSLEPFSADEGTHHV
jgi:hypothetical protein